MEVNATVHFDRAIVRRILKGDAAAFRTLFDSFFPRLYRFALARLDGDHAAASDVVQETFCKAIAQLDTYRGEAALYTWFCQVCRNTLIDYCRTMNRQARTVVLFEDEPSLRAVLEAFSAPASDSPDMNAWQRDIRRLVAATLDALPDRYGEVLEWKYVDGLSVREIADKLGAGPKAVESLLTRARVAFRDAILLLAETPDVLRAPRET